MSPSIDRSLVSVLVVDDQEHVRTFVRKLLSLLGVTNVTEAGDGQEALTAVSRAGAWFDLILCDLRMPVRDGIETIRAFAALGVESAVAIMSMEPERVIETAALLGDAQGLRMLGTLQKPITLDILEDVFVRMVQMPASAPRGAGMATTGDLANAFARDELCLLYQPRISFRTGKVARVESLVRWKHPELGLLGPESFVTAMEEHDEHGAALLKFCLTEAMACAARWQDGGHELRVVTTLPARAFNRLDLPERLEDMARAAGIPPERITFQVTEAPDVFNAMMTIDILTRLALKSFSLSIDHFGASQSTPSSLRRMPFSEMRIDREFVHNCASSAANRAVVEASLSLAKNLKMTSVADGIQQRPEWNLLDSLGCDEGQGPFIARPMSEEGLSAWITQWTLR